MTPPSPGFGGFWAGNCERDMYQYGTFYQLPSVSLKTAVYHKIAAGAHCMKMGMTSSQMRCKQRRKRRSRRHVGWQDLMYITRTACDTSECI